MNEQLKPCPFCGGEATGSFWYVTCSDKKCCCYGKLFDKAAWNRRADAGITATGNGVLRTEWETPNICNHCTEHLAADWSYCPECGMPQYAEEPLTEAQSEWKEKILDRFSKVR